MAVSHTLLGERSWLSFGDGWSCWLWSVHVPGFSLSQPMWISFALLWFSFPFFFIYGVMKAAIHG